MQNGWQEVDKEEANDCTINADDVVDVDLKVTNDEANPDHKDEIDYLWHAHESLLRLVNSYNIKQPLSKWGTMYLLINKNSGKTE